MIYSDGQNVIKGAWASRPHSKLERRQEDLSVLSRREFDSQPLQTQSLRKGLPLNDMLSSWGYCPVRLTFQSLQFSGGRATTTNLISTGSTVPGIQMSLTQTGLTRRRHGNPRKSIWKTAASWFSNPPDKHEARLPKNRRQKNYWQSGMESYARAE
jgi:hypothetical protein